MHDGLEDSILGRPLRCYKSITVDDEEEWHRCKIIIAHQAHKNTKCPNYTNTIEVTFKYILDIKRYKLYQQDIFMFKAGRTNTSYTQYRITSYSYS